jgi:hypothetical protein
MIILGSIGVINIAEIKASKISVEGVIYGHFNSRRKLQKVWHILPSSVLLFRGNEPKNLNGNGPVGMI